MTARPPFIKANVNIFLAKDSRLREQVFSPALCSRFDLPVLHAWSPLSANTHLFPESEEVYKLSIVLEQTNRMKLLTARKVAGSYKAAANELLLLGHTIHESVGTETQFTKKMQPSQCMSFP